MHEENKMNKTGLAAPWVTWYRELLALFGDDPEVNVTYDQDRCRVKLYVQNQEKAEAIARLLPGEKAFGNVVLKVEVIPANMKNEPLADIYRKAFEGNPAFSYTHTTQGAFAFSYVVFANKVVQFFNDNLADVNGNCSTLYQDIARDVFGDDADVFFCTDQGDPAEE